MDALIMAGQLIAGLAILVTLHELGHFLAARAFGIKVEKFYLFFDAWGFKLFSFKKGDTEYGIGWLPLGGYVKIAGMIDESLDTEQLSKAPEPWEFRAKPAWQRLIVMIGGVTMNVLLGIIIFSFSFFHLNKCY
jgi:regulator of sigma E protease